MREGWNIIGEYYHNYWVIPVYYRRWRWLEAEVEPLTRVRSVLRNVPSWQQPTPRISWLMLNLVMKNKKGFFNWCGTWSIYVFLLCFIYRNINNWDTFLAFVEYVHPIHLDWCYSKLIIIKVSIQLVRKDWKRITLKTIQNLLYFSYLYSDYEEAADSAVC